MYRYLERVDTEISILRDGYVDLSTHCITKFAQLIFQVDFKTVMPGFFTPQWYQAPAMSQIVVTFDEYIGDYKKLLHPTLVEIFIEELSDELLVRYLLSVRNKGAKIKRQDPFTDKIMNDVSTFFDFVNDNPLISGDVNNTIVQKWRVGPKSVHTSDLNSVMLCIL